MKYHFPYWKDPYDSWFDGRNKYHHYLSNVEELKDNANETLSILEGIKGNTSFDNIYIDLATSFIHGDPTVPTQPKEIANMYIANTEYVNSKLADLAYYYSPRFTGTPKAPVANDNEYSYVMATTGWVNNASSNYIELDSPYLRPNNATTNVSNLSNDDSIASTLTTRNIISSKLSDYGQLLNPNFVGEPTVPYPYMTNGIATTEYVMDKATTAVSEAFDDLKTLNVEIGVAKHGDTLPIDNEHYAFIVAHSFGENISAIGLAKYDKHIVIDDDGKITCTLTVADVSDNETVYEGKVTYIFLNNA